MDVYRSIVLSSFHSSVCGCMLIRLDCQSHPQTSGTDIIQPRRNAIASSSSSSSSSSIVTKQAIVLSGIPAGLDCVFSQELPCSMRCCLFSEDRPLGCLNSHNKHKMIKRSDAKEYHSSSFITRVCSTQSH